MKPVFKIFIASFFISSSPTMADDHHHDHHHKEKATTKGKHTQKAHVHGEAKFNIVISTNTALVELESPADSVYGFEHAPKTSEQKKAVATANAKLKADATKMLAFSPDPKCAPTVVLELPFEDHAHDHTKKGKKDEHGHSDVRVKLVYKCKENLENRNLTVNVRTYLPKIENLHTVVVTSKKQYSTKITAKSQTLKL